MLNMLTFDIFKPCAFKRSREKIKQYFVKIPI